MSDEKASVRLAYDDKNLYAFFSVTDPTPMVNDGNDFQKLFKTGDMVDIQISPQSNKKSQPQSGDMRLMLGNYQGKAVAVMAKQVDNNKNPVDSHLYRSPVMGITFDTVKKLENAKVVIGKSVTGYTIEASIPLADIGLTAQAGTLVTGDVGIITSDSTGTKDSARIYYYNKDTGLTDDLPGEAILHPDKWGIFKFVE